MTHLETVRAFEQVALKRLAADGSSSVEEYVAVVDALANVLINVAVVGGGTCPDCTAMFLARACNQVRKYSQQAQLRYLPAEGSA